MQNELWSELIHQLRHSFNSLSCLSASDTQKKIHVSDAHEFEVSEDPQSNAASHYENKLHHLLSLFEQLLEWCVHHRETAAGESSDDVI